MQSAKTRQLYGLWKKMAYFQAPCLFAKEEDLPYFFYQMVDYFDNVLHKPFYISLADAEAVEYLNLDPEKFEVTELDDLKRLSL